MSPHPHSHRINRSSGFTLIEIILAITIFIVLVAAVVPSYQGVADAQKARRPVRALLEMSKEARRLAMIEGRPYQIVFDEKGFRATRYFSAYAEQADLADFLAELNLANDAVEATRSDLVEDEPNSLETALGIPDRYSDRQLAAAYEFEDGYRCEIYLWGEAEPVPIEGALTRTWIFQPNGLCQPLRARFIREKSFFEVTFNSLTGDIIRERSGSE